MDRDIKRKSTTRISPRGGAIVYGIEGSKVVLAALERTKIEDDIAFLKPVADNATALLSTIREIREGEVDDEFAGLALDACGLAFILVSECYRFRRDHDQVPDKLIWGSNELAEYLRDDIHSFVQKKISRGFLKRHFMHATDDEKIAKFREKLRLWMGKLGIQTDLSIHEKVETIISERMWSRNEEGETIQSTKSHPEPFKHVEGKRPAEKPLPQIVVSDPRDDEGLKGQTGSMKSVGSVDEETPKRYALLDEDLDRRKTRKEEERMTRKAERERWRRSEQEFRLLPLQEMNADERPPRPASVASFGSQAYSFESVQSSVVAFPPSTSKNDEGTDRELALRLQAQLAKEIEEEDEKKALEIGIALHHQWEAEEKARSDKQRTVESNVQLRTPDSMDSRSLKPQARALSIHSEAKQRQHTLPGVKISMPDDADRSNSYRVVPSRVRAHKAN